MTLSTYLNEELGAAHRRDLLAAAEHHRLAAQARQPHGARFLRSIFRREPRRQAARTPCLSPTTPSTAVR